MKKYIYFLLLTTSLLLTNSSLAAELYLFTPKSTVNAAEEFSVDIRLHSDNHEINAVEATMLYPEYLNLVQPNLKNSFISFWIRGPETVKSSVPGFKSITMSGLTPGGLAVAGDVVASFTFSQPTTSPKSVPLLFTLKSARVLENDGLGTPLPLNTKNLTLQVGYNTTSSLVSTILVTKDQVPPEDFKIALAKNPSLFNNQWFVAFNAVDLDSGIDYYEFQENTFYKPYETKWKIAQNPVLLQDQSLKSYIFVRATDRAGNKRTATLKPKTNLSLASYTKIIFGCIILAGLFVLLVRLFVLRRRGKQT